MISFPIYHPRMAMAARPYWLLALLSISCCCCFAQSPKPVHQTVKVAGRKAIDWSGIVSIDIDPKKYPGKYKVVTDILNSMAADAAGIEIFQRIQQNNPGKVKIKDKEEILTTTNNGGISTMFSADYGIQVIKQDMNYNPIDNELVLNFGKSGEMLSFDEQKHQFFKVSLNSTIATELEAAGVNQPPVIRNCRQLLQDLSPDEKFLFDNYKDLMGEKFTDEDIEHCRRKKITIHNFTSNADETYTFSDKVTDALKAYRDFAEMYKANAYALNTRHWPLAQRYTGRLGEPHRCQEPVFTVRLGENRSRPLQFGPITGTDYIALDSGQQNVYKNFSVFYDTEDRQPVDNTTALTRIKEEYIAQLRYNTMAINAPKMLEYADRLKKYFNAGYKPDTNYPAIQEAALQKVMNNNPYLEGANRVIEAEVIWSETRNGSKKH